MSNFLLENFNIDLSEWLNYLQSETSYTAASVFGVLIVAYFLLSALRVPQQPAKPSTPTKKEKEVIASSSESESAPSESESEAPILRRKRNSISSDRKPVGRPRSATPKKVAASKKEKEVVVETPKRGRVATPKKDKK